MNYFKKSILFRVFGFFCILAFILGILGAVFYFWQEKISLSFFLLTLGFFLLLFLGIFWYEVVRPLKFILEQMRALLTGRHYLKIFTSRIDEIAVIAHFFNEVTKNMEKISHQIREGKRMLGELEIASQLQSEILPSKAPKVDGLEIVAKTKPAVELGGDNFDFITEKENTFMYVGDVTGHGVPAAIVMTMVHTLIHTFVEIYDTALEVVVQTNRRLKTRIKSTMFMTMLMLRWNSTTQKMTYVGAGHEHLLIYRVRSGTCEVKMSGGIALGMIADNSKIVKELELTLEKGDVIILYTDGITEGRNTAGEMFTLERLKKSVEIHAPQYGPEGIVSHVARDFSRFVENHIQDDDITLIAIRYVGTDTTPSEPAVEKSTNWGELEEKSPTTELKAEI